MRFTGKLKTWTEDRGFGFITPTEGGQDIFVHISDYPRGQTPALNERLSFEVALNPQGKKKAVKVRMEDEVSLTRRQDSARTIRRDSAGHNRGRNPTGGLLRGIVTLTVIALIAWAGYRHYISRLAPSTAASAPVQGIGGLSRSQAPAASRFSCDGRTRCSQMTSCEEATFFLTNCPGTKMDGDGDRVPCEKQWCK